MEKELGMESMEAIKLHLWGLTGFGKSRLKATKKYFKYVNKELLKMERNKKIKTYNALSLII